jgi:hypothetical protein
MTSGPPSWIPATLRWQQRLGFEIVQEPGVSPLIVAATIIAVPVLLIPVAAVHGRIVGRLR